MEYFPNQRLAGRPSHSPALSSLSARDMDHLRMSTVGFDKNEFMSPTFNSQRPSMSQLSSTPVMLSNFMTAEKGPWNQFVAFPDSGNQGGSTQAAGPVYSDYRNPPTFSVTSDSGYASQSKRYNDDMSSLGDATFDPDIQNMSTQFRTVNFDLSSPREPELPAASSRQNATAGTSARPDLECQGCGEVVKTKSVLRKHHQRHTKPYVCRVPGCTRDGGFSTQNDLNRHQGSVHKSSTSAPGKQYRCLIEQCKDKYKIWPRPDNFRSHLKSVHHIAQEDTASRHFLDRFLHQEVQTGAAAPRPARENGLDMLQGVGGGSIESELDPRGFPNTLTGWAMEANPSLPPGSSAVPGSDQGMADFEELHLDPEDGVTGSPATQQLFRHHDIPRQVHETLSHLPHSRPVSALGRADGSEARPFPVPSQGPRQAAGPAETASTIEPRLTYWSQAEQETNSHDLIARSNQDGNLEASSIALSLHQQPEASADLKPNSNHSRVLEETITHELDAQKEDAIIKALDRIPTDLLSRYLREKGISSNADSGRDSGDSGTEQKHLCVHVRCGRKFSRRSELNKHMRRHDKPYACTFPKCDSNFGSKSDWRRHENTQHFQLVVWKCDIPAEEGVCRQACYRRDAFERHLLEGHGISGGEGQEKAQERCRVDRSSSAKFWCGFCGDVVAVAPGGSNGAWGERYDHIGNHFTGCNGFRKADRGEWKCGDVDSSDEEMGEVEVGDGSQGKRKREEVEEGGRRVKRVARGV